jgi:AcrR family transcriptional regulator
MSATAQSAEVVESPAAGAAGEGYPSAARTLMRTMVLDAARTLLERRGWAQVTMADVARSAGVSRQTLYNAFGSRDELAQAVVLREQERLLTDVEAVILAHAADPVSAIREAFRWFLESAASDPVLRRALSDQGVEGIVPLLTTRGAPVVHGAVARLAQIIATRWPQAPDAEVEVMADCLVRLAISHAMLPAQEPGATASAIAALLAPHVERVLGTR